MNNQASASAASFRSRYAGGLSAAAAAVAEQRTALIAHLRLISAASTVTEMRELARSRPDAITPENLVPGDFPSHDYSQAISEIAQVTDAALMRGISRVPPASLEEGVRERVAAWLEVGSRTSDLALRPTLTIEG